MADVTARTATATPTAGPQDAGADGEHPHDTGEATRPVTIHEQLTQRLLAHLANQHLVTPGQLVGDVSLTLPAKPGVSRRRVTVDLAVPADAAAPHTNLRLVALIRPDADAGDPRAGVALLARLLDSPACTPDAASVWTNGRAVTWLRRTTGDTLQALPGPPTPHPTRRLVWPARADELHTTLTRCLRTLEPHALSVRDTLGVLVDLSAAAAADDRWASRGHTPRFWAASPHYDQSAAARLRALLADVADDPQLGGLLGPHAQALDDGTLAALVGELAAVDVNARGLDLLGAAYSQLTSRRGRGARGQYLTPTPVAAALAALADPRPGQRILDPACGSGRLLNACLDHTQAPNDTAVVGVDLDPDLVWLAAANLRLRGRAGQLQAANSLSLPDEGPLGSGSFDIVVANPPFGDALAVDDPDVLARYQLGHHLQPTPEGWQPTRRLRPRLPPEVLFVERCLGWTRPGGRIALLLPTGLLANPGWTQLRAWLLERVRLQAVVELPATAFLPAVNVSTSILLATRRARVTPDWAKREGEWPIFMAAAESVGYDRRGRVAWRRTPDGRLAVRHEPLDITLADGTRVHWQIPCRVPDDDLPDILAAYAAFQAETRPRRVPT